MAVGDDIRDAARVALEARDGETAAGGRVTRAVLDVTVDGRTEIVTVALRGPDLLCTCTDGQAEGPHVTEALRLLAAEGLGGRLIRTTSPGDVPSVERKSPPPSEPPRPSTGRAALAGPLEDLLTAIVRVGVREAKSSPTVDETIDRLVAAAPSPLPPGLARWLGMLRAALSHRDTDRVGRLLFGASQLARDLRADIPGSAGRQRMLSFAGRATGDAAEVTRVSDRVMIEVAREYLRGLERASVERRYLVCLDTGNTYREERLRGAPGVSVGPCPRVITVGLAEVEPGPSPQRITLSQYAVSNVVTADDWSRLENVAARSFTALSDSYRRALGESPGLTEPFAVVAPKGCEHDPMVLLDTEGLPLPIALAEAPAFRATLERFVAGHKPAWVAGRLVDAAGRLMLLPCSAGMRNGAEHRVLRIS